MDNMYTVCWVDDDGFDRWDRVMKDNLAGYLEENGLIDAEGNIDEDCVIFPPRSEMSHTDVHILLNHG